MSPKHLLIVDDSPLILNRLRVLLEGLLGLGAIDSAGTCKEAFAFLSGPQVPDIVLLDINLPDGTGIDILRHVHKQHPKIIVIMQSNQGGIFYRNLCLQLGASHFIDKSTEFQFIPSILASLCSDNL